MKLKLTQYDDDGEYMQSIAIAWDGRNGTPGDLILGLAGEDDRVEKLQTCTCGKDHNEATVQALLERALVDIIAAQNPLLTATTPDELDQFIKRAGGHRRTARDRRPTGGRRRHG